MTTIAVTGDLLQLLLRVVASKGCRNYILDTKEDQESRAVNFGVISEDASLVFWEAASLEHPQILDAPDDWTWHVNAKGAYLKSPEVII